ncbi:hypothetical protein EMIHUDRAFT_219741 [Emiliania huxleyi CCMP1516]|uniref:Glycerophosphocholine acyltransferase 1 n=2 Tax=Emiliania huxleyi TaxID=2903 RepID=A0A0D3I408_EMIH1|nr:hypothetical protein EMIHUDRAFT_219741 [Emiliania huxleyi CCMP1516]EOD05993.1 hypothetical protein EMIHUDRAFT_219741 [Emiliania huxleyi CCMP1516]|eukprot:XP_005758422.1 hypothetical protein EMIHUDRAFT_219741 [Emiliania huxleyi CCMP1516]
MHPKFHASSSFVTSIFLQYLANAVRACWGVIAFGSALVPALYPISLRWLLYESPYDHLAKLPSVCSAVLLARASLQLVLASFHLLLSYATWLCVFGFLCLRFGFWIFYCTLFIYL